MRNLPVSVSDDDLFQEFQKHGSVINCQVLRDRESNSKQRGLINFITKEQAQKAIESTNDKPFPGSSTDLKLCVIYYREHSAFNRT